MVNAPQDWLNAKIRMAEDRIKEIRDEIAALQELIGERQEDLLGLQIRCDVLTEMRDEGVIVPPTAERVAGKPDPGDAVDTLVRENPGVYTRKQIMDTLERATSSEAENVRAVISSAVGRRLQDGRFFRDNRKRVWPGDHPDIQAQRQIDNL